MSTEGWRGGAVAAIVARRPNIGSCRLNLWRCGASVYRNAMARGGPPVGAWMPCVCLLVSPGLLNQLVLRAGCRWRPRQRACSVSERAQCSKHAKGVAAPGQGAQPRIARCVAACTRSVARLVQPGLSVMRAHVRRTHPEYTLACTSAFVMRMLETCM